MGLCGGARVPALAEYAEIVYGGLYRFLFVDFRHICASLHVLSSTNVGAIVCVAYSQSPQSRRFYFRAPSIALHRATSQRRPNELRSGDKSWQLYDTMNHVRATRSIWSRSAVPKRLHQTSRRTYAAEAPPPHPPSSPPNPNSAPPPKEPSRVVRHTPTATIPLSSILTNPPTGRILRQLRLAPPKMLPRRPLHIPTLLLLVVQTRSHRRDTRHKSRDTRLARGASAGD